MEDNLFIFNSKKEKVKSGFTDIIKKNIYVCTIMKIVLLLVVVFLLDFIVGSLLRKLYFSETSGKLYLTTYSMEETTSDLLIFGSSTANHEYSPIVFENRLHISSYNTGRDGTSIFYQYAILQSILKRYSPKIILLNLDLEEFKKDPSSYDRISSLLPYYKTHPEIRSVINLKSKHERTKLLSKIYPFNSLLFTIFVGNMDFNKQRRNDFQGFVPLKNVLKQPLGSGYYPQPELDSNKIRLYKSFIRDCINANVQLYIICSPIHMKLKNSPNSIVLGQRIAEENNIKFFNFLNDTDIINHPSYFADLNHLNDKGAEIFSNKLADKITNEGYD